MTSGSGSTDQPASPNNKPLRSVRVLPAIRSAPSARVYSPEEEIRQLRALPYHSYLLTPWWRSRRNLALRDADYKCQRCEVKRNLEVHHRSYERLGAELPEDLEVVCRGCHLGHHFNETQEFVKVYTRVVSEVISSIKSQDIAEVIEEAKSRLSALRIVIHHEQFHVAVSRLVGRMPATVQPSHAELYEVRSGTEPLTKAEAAGILAKIGAAVAMKHMPEVKPLTERQRDKLGALRIVMQAIKDQIHVCEDVEQNT